MIQANFYNEIKALDRAISDFENDVVHEMKKCEILNNYEFWKDRYTSWKENENYDCYEEIKKDTVMVYMEENPELQNMIELYSCVDFITERLVNDMWDEIEEGITNFTRHTTLKMV